MNAAMYGVPQMRERAFLMAIHQEVGATIRFPEPTHQIVLPASSISTERVDCRADGQGEGSSGDAEGHPRPGGRPSC